MLKGGLNISKNVSIIMYHYVRDLKYSRYPEIKGLAIDLFKEQLQYIMKYYEIIEMKELIDAILHGKELPNNSLILTFDDGYKDHFEFVFPVLDDLGIQGCFFPPVKAILEHQVLDVNKIHFILASVKDKEKLISDIYSMLDEYREDYFLEKNEYYFNKVPKNDKFDTKEVVFIKRILQKDIPEKPRKEIANRLFKKYVCKNEESFSRELYLSIDQLNCMHRKGMFIGSHGYDHYWLNTLSKEQQRREIELSIEFLKSLGCDIGKWVMCYPYGAYNDSLLSLLKENGCALGLTTDARIADLNYDNPLILPRLDTNDLPKDKNAKPN